jgi:D-xylose 1-dehydrogenase (NADP+, D-xylono-1,5-lactone-forming)
MKIRWGFLGAGWIATTALGPAVHQATNGVLYAVASRELARSRSLQPEKVHASYADLIDDPEVDAIYISLANHQHCEWAIKALNAGKHVLCEKPLALNATEARSMAKAAAANDRLLVEAVWARWHPRFARMVNLVRAGDLGDLETINSSFMFSANLDGNYRLSVEMGGGSLLDVGTYQVHSWAAFTDLKEYTPTVVERHVDQSGVDLTTEFSGVIDGKIHVSAIASFEREEKQHLALTGSVNTVECIGNQAFTSWHTESALRIGDMEELFAPVDPYRLMIENFGSRILGEESWLLNVQESIRVMEILDQIAETTNNKADQPQ